MLRRRAAAWCRGHGLVEDAIEYAAAAGDAETVAELLVEHDREFVWGGRVGQFLGWVRWLPSELLLEHPSLPAAGAFAAAMLARPEVEIQRLLAVAERARRERPQLWSPYVEAVVEVTRAMAIERGDVGAAVEHARRAVAAARAGADVLSVGVLASLVAGPVLRRRARRGAADRGAGRRAARRAGLSPKATSSASGCSRWSTPSKGEPRARRRGRVRRSASRAQRFQADSWSGVAGAPWACAGVRRDGAPRRGRARGAARRAFATLAAAHRRSRSCPARARAGPRRAIAAGARRQRPRARAKGDRGVSRSGAATGDRRHRRAGPHHGSSECRKRHIVEEPSAAELAVLRCLAAGLSRREIGAQLYISLNTVKTHTRELYRKLGATSRADAVARAEALGLLDPTESPG